MIGMPLYNFGVPSTVKAWFDRLVVPGLTISEGGGLLGGRTLVTGASGGGYGPGTPREGLGPPRPVADPRLRAARPHRRALHPRGADPRTRKPGDDPLTWGRRRIRAWPTRTPRSTRCSRPRGPPAADLASAAPAAQAETDALPDALYSSQCERPAYIRRGSGPAPRSPSARGGRSQAEVLREAVATYQPKPSQDRNFALAGSGHGDGSSIVDVPEEDLLKGFGE